MLSERLKSEYKKARRLNFRRAYTLTARESLRMAREIVERKSADQDTEFEIDGFDVRIKLVDDEYPDLSYLGKYTDTYEDGAIDRWARSFGSSLNRRPGPVGRRRYKRGNLSIPRYFFEDPRAYIRNTEYRYWVPCNTYHDHLVSMLTDRKLRRGEAYRLARLYVEQDYEEHERYGQSWWMHDLKVTASREGIVLGTAYLGGIHSEDEQPLRSIAEEHGMIDEAVEEAKATLERMCKRGAT